MDYEKELASALADLEAATKKGDCGCGGTVAARGDHPLLRWVKEGDALSNDLASALEALGTEERVASDLSSKTLPVAELASREFGEIDMGDALGLDEIISIAERYPGLKITFSFS